jgi:hypothetical protein
MAGGSTLDPDNLADESPRPGAGAMPAREGRARGSDTGSLGPSDSTDSGSDLVGTRQMPPEELLSDSDAAGTGDRAGVDPVEAEGEDIGFDRTIGVSEAGLGTGLDEAELARREHPEEPDTVDDLDDLDEDLDDADDDAR